MLSCLQVGKTGSVLGIDCMHEATLLARRNIRRQVRRNPEFADKAAPCAFHTHNTFLPAANFQVRLLASAMPTQTAASLLPAQ